MTDELEPEFDFMADRIGLKYASYNSAVDEQIYNVAKMIVESRKKRDAPAYNSDIATALGMSPEHVELIQYILCGVRYPEMDKSKERGYGYNSAFTYGTSPRGLFVDDEAQAERFMAEFEVYLKEEWGEKE